MSFAPSWNTRGSHTDVTAPKLLAEKLVLTPLNCVWLKVLKLSKRSSKRLPRASLRRKLLNSERFQLSRPGPRTAPFFRLPHCPGAGSENAPGLNHDATVCG